MSRKFKSEFIELRSLGSGGFSTVFEAKLINDEKTYAIKKIPFINEEKEKTLKEIEFLKSLKSDFVVFCYDWWIEENYYIGPFDIKNKQNISSDNLLYSPYKPLLLHIQMELCSLTLSDFINQMNITKLNPLTNEQYISVCDIFIQLLECVQYLHQLNPPIIHRDLKPKNVILMTEINSYKVKLTDVGLSTYHTYIDESHTKYIGTHSYRAPEVEIKKQYDCKADIYSLGRIMEKLFNLDFDSDIELNSYYKNAKQICLKCVSYTPKLRPNCQQILNEKHLWSFSNNNTNHLFEKDLKKRNHQIYKRLFEKFPFFNKIERKLLLNCKKLAIIEEIEEKVIFDKKDRKIYAFRVSDRIDSTVQEPIIVKELMNKEIKTIVCGYEHVLCLTKDQQIFSFGNNIFGQLGNGTYLRNNKPSNIVEINDKQIIDIKCGAYHSLALSENGNVFVFGNGSFGQIGNGFKELSNTPIELISFNSEKVISISCGFHHCLALTESGILYGWGKNNNGQLGIGCDDNQRKPIPIEFEANIKIKKICCGNNYSLVLTNDNKIYSFGDNDFGQLGIGNYIEQNKPILINTNIKFIDIQTTFYHCLSIGLSSDNIYYVWGQCNDKSIHTPKSTNFNSFYETFIYYSLNFKIFQTFLTTESFFKTNSSFMNKLNEWNIFKPLSREMMFNIKSFCVVRLNEIKAILVTNDDIVYSIRLNESIDSSPKQPVIVNEFINKCIIKIIFGREHVLCLTENNEVYAFGYNNAGQLGNGSQINNYKPTIITELISKEIVDISCGAFHCLALSKSGKIFVWGNGDIGQIGDGNNYVQLTPFEIEYFRPLNIILISCGSHHCLALSSNGDLYGWGDLCYGDVNIHYKPVLIENSDKIIFKKVSCGCDHSLILTKDHNIYSFGRNNFGQLGIGNRIDQNKLIRIETNIKFTDIHTNWCDNISAGLSQNGKYYVWGKCGEDLIIQPRESECTSFDEIIIKYSTRNFLANQINFLEC